MATCKKLISSHMFRCSSAVTITDMVNSIFLTKHTLISDNFLMNLCLDTCFWGPFLCTAIWVFIPLGVLFSLFIFIFIFLLITCSPLQAGLWDSYLGIFILHIHWHFLHFVFINWRFFTTDSNLLSLSASFCETLLYAHWGPWRN